MRQQQARAARRARVDEDLTGAERLVLAILDHRIVHFDIMGTIARSSPICSACTTRASRCWWPTRPAGASQNGQIPGWRAFITTSVEDVVIDDRHFPGPRGDLDVEKHRMLEVFARA